MNAKSFLQIAKYIGLITLIIWVLLSIVVVIFLFDRWNDPQTKSISNHDLLDYISISIWFLMVFGISKLSIFLVKKRIN